MRRRDFLLSSAGRPPVRRRGDMAQRSESGWRATAPRTNGDVIPDASRSWIYFASLTIALGIAYFLAARLSLLLLTKPDGVAVFWPAAGVSAGVLIGLGPRARLPVIVRKKAATVQANISGDVKHLSGICF